MKIDRVKVLEKAQKYAEKKAYPQALEQYRMLLQADPKDARTLLKTAELEAKTGAFAAACDTYETLAKLYTRQGFVPKAIAVYRQMREVIGKNGALLEQQYGHIVAEIGELYERLGHINEARTAYDEAARRLVQQGRDPEAITVLRRIVKLEPHAVMSRVRLAEALVRAGDVHAAVAELDFAARALRGHGQIEDALRVTERLLHLRLDMGHARNAAEMYLARGAEGDAIRALEKLRPCFTAEPRDIGVLTLLVKAFAEAGYPKRSFDAQKQLARAARDAGKSSLFRETVQALLGVAPTDEAVRELGVDAQLLSGPVSRRISSTPTATSVPPSMRASAPPLAMRARMPSIPPPPLVPSIMESGSSPLPSAMWSCAPPALDASQPPPSLSPPSGSDVFPAAASRQSDIVPTAGGESPGSLRLRVSDVPQSMVRTVRMVSRKGA